MNWTQLSASSTTDKTNATKITSGTLNAGRLPAFTGDVTTSAGSSATTVAKIANVAVGTPTGTGNVVFSASPTLSGTVSVGTAGSSTGIIAVGGATSGTITIQPQAAAGTYN